VSLSWKFSRYRCCHASCTDPVCRYSHYEMPVNILHLPFGYSFGVADIKLCCYLGISRGTGKTGSCRDSGPSLQILPTQQHTTWRSVSSATITSLIMLICNRDTTHVIALDIPVSNLVFGILLSLSFF